MLKYFMLLALLCTCATTKDISCTGSPTLPTNILDATLAAGDSIRTCPTGFYKKTFADVEKCLPEFTDDRSCPAYFEETTSVVSGEENRCVLSALVGRPTVKMALGSDGKCNVGYHVSDTKCLPNTDNCTDYDCRTHNCFKCNFWYFQIDSDEVTTDGDRTGNYCVSRVWAWLLMFLAALLFLLLIVGIIVYFLTRKPAKVEKKPLLPVKKPVVSVGAPRPSKPVTVVHERIERGEPITHTGQSVVTEHREQCTYGDRVHVETRTYSPQREMHREQVNEPNWATYSQAHWNDHY